MIKIDRRLYKKSLKEIQEINLLFRWGLFLIFIFSIILAFLLETISFNLVHNKAFYSSDRFFTKLIYLFDVKYDLDTKILAVLIAFFIIGYFGRYFALIINGRYLSRFTHLKEIGTYVESLPKIYFSEKKYDHIVMLIHGYSGATQEFEYLVNYLKENNINYVANNILGFGLDRLTLLSYIKRKDWYRTILNQYDYLSSISNRVSIVGQSMGAILASYIASNRKVHKLIFTAPGFYPSAVNMKHKKLLTHTFISKIYLFFTPFSPKPINKEYGYLASVMDPYEAKKSFHYLTIPLKSIRELFFMQDELRLDNIQFDSLYLLYGKYEKTVNIDKVRRGFENADYEFTEVCFLNSGHNILVDYDKDDACQYISDILKI